MFGLIAYDRLYIKVDEDSKSRFQEAGSQPFVYDGKGKPIEMSYWATPEGTLEDPAALLPCAELGLVAARRARAKKPLRKPQRKPQGKRRAT